MQHFNYDLPTPPPAIGVVAVSAATGLVSAGQGGAGQGTTSSGQSNGQNNIGQNSGQGNGQGNTGLGSLTPAVGSSYAGQGTSGVASQGSALSGSGSSGGSATPGRATAGIGTPGATLLPLPAERLSTAGLVGFNPLTAQYATSTPGQSTAGASRAGVGQLVGENVVRTVQQPAVGEVHGRFRQAVGGMGR